MNKIRVSRVIRKIQRGLRILGIGNSISQIQTFEPTCQIVKKILVIAPGDVTIPPKGWGAVETIISETIPVYVKYGFSVFLLNSKSIFDLIKSRKFKPDVILLHDDSQILRVRTIFPKKQIFLVSHYGLAAYKTLWHKSYKKIYKKFCLADVLVCLNPDILLQFTRDFSGKELLLSPNGSDLMFPAKKTERDGIICLGKVEPRKRQYEVFQILKNLKIKIIFAGDIADSRVEKSIIDNPALKEIFVGPWTRDEVLEKLPDFKALLLVSEGEADALVLYEAQNAGLHVIVNKSSLGSQDSSLPWIHVLDSEISDKDIATIYESIPNNSVEISAWSTKNYSWEIRNLALTQRILKETSSEKSN